MHKIKFIMKLFIFILIIMLFNAPHVFAYDNSNNESIKQTIQQYFHKHYKSIKECKNEDYNNIIKNKTLKSYVELNNKYIYKMNNGLNINLKDYKFKISYNNITYDTSSATINLNIESNLKYNKKNEENNITYDTENHILILKKYDNKWFIDSDIFTPLETADESEINNPNYTQNQLSGLTKAYSEINLKIKALNKPPNFKYNDSTKTNDSESIKSRSKRSIKYYPKVAVNYARKWAYGFNPNFPNFDKKGGDCTNFVSQCLWWGGIGRTSSWTCNKKNWTNSWIRVVDFANYMVSKGIATKKEYNYDTFAINRDARIGDVIQFYHAYKFKYSHTALVNSVRNGKIYYSGHSQARYDKELNDTLRTSWVYSRMRLLKIRH